jgi:short-subunit dehydrogenase
MRRLAQRYPAALVTGTSAGLGLAIARMLLAEGVRVIGLSRKAGVLEGHSNFTHVSCDLSDLPAVERVTDELWRQHADLNLLINNAGYGVLSELDKMPSASIQSQYAVLLIAPSLLARTAVAHFKSKGCGCLVNVSSLATELPLPLMPIYNASKCGLSALSQSLILELVEQPSCRVIDFRPGDFNTEFASRMTGQVEWNGVDLRTVMDRHHAIAPDVTRALKGLRRALLSHRSGVVRVGSFFQARIAPLGRLLPGNWLLRLIRSYYKH